MPKGGVRKREKAKAPPAPKQTPHEKNLSAADGLQNATRAASDRAAGFLIGEFLTTVDELRFNSTANPLFPQADVQQESVDKLLHAFVKYNGPQSSRYPIAVVLASDATDAEIQTLKTLYANRLQGDAAVLPRFDLARLLTVVNGRARILAWKRWKRLEGNENVEFKWPIRIYRSGLIADEDYSGIFVLHLLDRIPSADAPFRDVTLFRSYVLFAHRKKVDGRWEVSEDTVERGKLFELFGEPCRYLRRISRDSELRELLFKLLAFPWYASAFKLATWSQFLTRSHASAFFSSLFTSTIDHFERAVINSSPSAIDDDFDILRSTDEETPAVQNPFRVRAPIVTNAGDIKAEDWQGRDAAAYQARVHSKCEEVIGRLQKLAQSKDDDDRAAAARLLVLLKSSKFASDEDQRLPAAARKRIGWQWATASSGHGSWFHSLLCPWHLEPKNKLVERIHLLADWLFKPIADTLYSESPAGKKALRGTVKQISFMDAKRHASDETTTASAITLDTVFAYCFNYHKTILASLLLLAKARTPPSIHVVPADEQDNYQPAELHSSYPALNNVFRLLNVPARLPTVNFADSTLSPSQERVKDAIACASSYKIQGADFLIVAKEEKGDGKQNKGKEVDRGGATARDDDDNEGEEEEEEEEDRGGGAKKAMAQKTTGDNSSEDEDEDEEDPSASAPKSKSKRARQSSENSERSSTSPGDNAPNDQAGPSSRKKSKQLPTAGRPDSRGAQSGDGSAGALAAENGQLRARVAELENELDMKDEEIGRLKAELTELKGARTISGPGGLKSSKTGLQGGHSKG